MIAAALVLAAATPVDTAPHLLLFAERFYRGAVQRFAADTPQLPHVITPQSVRISGRWEVCSESQYRGRCLEIDRDYPVTGGIDAGFKVQSLRRLAAGAGAGKPVAGMVPGGTSIVGVASRYWPAPTYGNERVLACPGGKSSLNCAHDTAEDLCRRAGYRTVRYWQLQTVGVRTYLADILCTRSDDK